MTADILIIGHTDSGRNSGLAQDAHIISSMNCRAHMVLTALKATLNTEMSETPLVHIEPDAIEKQMDVCLKTRQIHAAKIGFLSNTETVEKVSSLIAREKKKHYFPIVVDPMILGAGRSRMHSKIEMDVLKRDLFILADIIVPSVAEAEALTGMEIQSMDDLRHVADMLLTLGPKAVYVRGAQFEKDTTVDLLATDSTQLTFNTPILRAFHNETSDKGGISSAAIAVGLAHNRPYARIIEDMLDYVRKTYLESL